MNKPSHRQHKRVGLSQSQVLGTFTPSSHMLNAEEAALRTFTQKLCQLSHGKGKPMGREGEEGGTAAS